MGIRVLTASEAAVVERPAELKDEAGSPSPSLLTLRERLPDLEVGVDACFISSPHATQLFPDHPQSEPIDTGAIEINPAVIHNFARERVLVNLPTFTSYEFAEGRVDVRFTTLSKEEELPLDADAHLHTVAESGADLVVLKSMSRDFGIGGIRRIIEALTDVLDG